MNIAKKIDHTNINTGATETDIRKLCQEAREYGFHGVCINPEWVSVASQELKESDVKVVVLIDPPMGLSSHDERMRICQKAKDDGADELDVVMNIVDLKYERYEKVLEDLMPICNLLDTKVIIGSGYLTDDEIKKASEIVKRAGAVCVKTATFKDPLEEREVEEKGHHLKIMRDAAPGLLIKASGNIRNYTQASYMADNGADIIGTSSGIQIVEDEKKATGQSN